VAKVKPLPLLLHLALLSIVAFFSRSKDPGAPTCDGFYQYIPATRSMVRWTRMQGKWKQEVTALPR
jgi:hypothetical protein